MSVCALDRGVGRRVATMVPGWGGRGGGGSAAQAGLSAFCSRLVAAPLCWRRLGARPILQCITLHRVRDVLCLFICLRSDRATLPSMTSMMKAYKMVKALLLVSYR